MANPSVRSTSSATSSSATFSVTKPAGTQTGDILLAFQATFLNSGTAPATPSGFTLLDSVAFNGAGDLVQCFWLLAGGSEPASYTFNNATGGLGGNAAVYLYAVQNAASTGPERDHTNSGSSTSPSTGAIVPAVNNELLCAAFGFTTTPSISAQAFSDATAVTDLGTLVGTQIKLDSFYGSQATAASVSATGTLSGIGGPFGGMIVSIPPQPLLGNVYFTGFETGDTSEIVNALTGTASIQTGTVRSGTYALQCNPVTTATGFAVIGGLTVTGTATISAASVATSFVRFYFNIGTAPGANNEVLVVVYDTGVTEKFAIRLNAARNLVATDSSESVLATGSTVLSTATWYRIEFKCSTGASTTWEVKINGTSEISGSGANLGATNAGTIRLGKVYNSNGQSVNFFYDDFMWSDTAYPGAGQCVVLVPVANGTYQTWTPSSVVAPHYQLVREIPPDGDTTYLTSDNVAGDAETESVTTGSTAGITGTVNSVKSLAVLKRDGGTNGAVTVRLRVAGSTNSDTVSYASTSGYVGIMKMINTNPANSLAWTVGDTNTLEVGAVEQQAGGNKTRMTATYVMVDFTPGTAPTGPPTAPPAPRIYAPQPHASLFE